MKDILTIVIPCKNENKNIYDCIEHISKQKSIEGTTVIIADNSDSDESINWLYKTKYDFMDKLQIKIIKGGYPSKARLEGSKLVSTPYVLFIDADILLTESNILESISLLDFDLVTTTFSTEKNWNWVFRTFDIFQKISIILGTPFAIGGFQYWKTKKYWELGGFDPEEMIAEDYRISSKCDKHSFKIYKTSGVYTSARRFKNKGILYMFIIMIKSYINRNNPEFFKKHHNYWK
jgi:glycosyltransferase involved in cell wall biosynthesis